MAEKLKIIPLGGLDEIGKNITVLEYGKDMIVVDCGVGFPEEDMYGVDLVIPDFSYLVQNSKKLRGMFITHGHEDHIGSIPYAMRQLSCPIHGTAMTNGLIKLKLEEHRLADKVKLVTHKPGDVVKAGCFSVEFIHVNHSIADAVAFAIKTPVGTVVMTGDFKIDPTAVGGMTDLARLGQLAAPLFAPLGFGDWRMVTALVSGFTAKEAVVSTFGVILGVSAEQLQAALHSLFDARSAASFLTFCLLYTPCVAAVATIRRELGSKWKTVAVVIAQCLVAWLAALLVYQIGGFFV